MTTDHIIQMLRSAVVLTIVLSLPVIGAAFVVSFITSLVQALTSMQESTLSTVPRLLVAAAVSVCVAPWATHKLVAYTAGVFSSLGQLTR